MAFSRLLQKITAFLSSVLLLLSTSLFGAVYPPEAPEDNTFYTPEGKTLILIQGGSSEYRIVRGASASESEKNAASVLADYLARISGVTLSVVTDAEEKTEKEIIVGKTTREGNRFTVDRDDLGDEGYTIMTSDKNLVIAGGERRGTLYGVYAFLEKYLNCRWFTKDVIRIPQTDTVEIPETLSLTEKPYLEYRETDWISPHDHVYSVANRQNGNIYRVLSEANGGNFGYAGSFAHTMTNGIVPADKYFDEHPEYFALGVKSGKRTKDQLCLTNPDTLQTAINDVLALIKANPKANIVSVTQHDNQNYCACDECKRIDEEEGAHSGTLIRFINAIADAVKEAGYNDVKIDTFAYQYTRQAPKITKPRDNVIVRFCTIECCFAHPISECSEAESMRQDLSDWKAICDTLYVWDYTTNYANYLAPFPDFGVIQKNLQYFVENNVVGVYEEGNYSAYECDGEFAELRAYLLSKLLWDPYINMSKAMNEFLEAYYGNGWKSIRNYIDMLTANTGRRTFFGQQHMSIYAATNSEGMLFLNGRQAAYCTGLWQDALKSAQTVDMALRVRKSELSWRYWKACNEVLEFSRLQKENVWKENNKKLYDDMVALGIRRLCEGAGGELSVTPDFALTPDKWYASFKA